MTLSFTIVDAHLVHNPHFFEQTDPFAVLRFKNQEIKTRYIENEKTNPVWNETFEIVVGENNLGSIDIIDKNDILADKLIGSATFSFKKLLDENYVINKIPIMRGKENTGYVRIRIKSINGNKDDEIYEQHAQNVDRDYMPVPYYYQTSVKN